MKRIMGFMTALFLVIGIVGTGFATQEDIMRKQTKMTGNQTAMSKVWKKAKHRKFHKHRKGRKIVRKSTVK